MILRLKKRPGLGRLLAPFYVLLFTAYDIFIVEGVFAALQAWDTIHVYHIATYSFLIPALTVLMAFSLRSWRFALYSFVGIYGGWLDILYYVLQGKPLPDFYSWYPIPMYSSQLMAFATCTLLLAIMVDVSVLRKYQ